MFVNVIAVKMASKRQHEHETNVEEDKRTGVTAKKKKWLTKFKGCYSSEFQSTISYHRHQAINTGTIYVLQVIYFTIL